MVRVTWSRTCWAMFTVAMSSAAYMCWVLSSAVKLACPAVKRTLQVLILAPPALPWAKWIVQLACGRSLRGSPLAICAALPAAYFSSSLSNSNPLHDRCIFIPLKTNLSRFCPCRPCTALSPRVRPNFRLRFGNIPASPPANVPGSRPCRSAYAAFLCGRLCAGRGC